MITRMSVCPFFLFVYLPVNLSICPSSTPLNHSYSFFSFSLFLSLSLSFPFFLLFFFFHSLFLFPLVSDGSTDGWVLGFHSWVVHSPIRWVRCGAVWWPPPTPSFQLLRHRRRPVARSPSAKMATAKLWLPSRFGLLLRDQRPLCLPVVEISAI